jgi:hypothetical protein
MEKADLSLWKNTINLFPMDANDYVVHLVVEAESTSEMLCAF